MNNCLHVESKIKIEAEEQVNIEFSADGKFMAIFYIEDSLLEFYKIKDKDITETLLKLADREPTYKIKKD